MRYITSKLDWEGAEGQQPYPDLTGLGVTFEGGVIVKDSTPCTNRLYFGYMNGTDEAITNALSACNEKFEMNELTQAQALAFFMEVIPLNTVRTDINGNTKYTGQATVNESGRIDIPLSDTQWV